MNLAKLNKWLTAQTGAKFVVDYMGGNCPVQAEGTVDGKLFYFRARGCGWSFQTLKPQELLSYGEPEPGQFYYSVSGSHMWPDAGWIGIKETLALICRAAKLYRENPVLHKEIE